MENKKLIWCFRLRDGLRMLEPNEELSKSYLEQAKLSLLRAEKDLNEKDLLWSTVAIYYAEYYALYSFLQKIGIKCENHACSILTVGFLLGEDKIKIINQHRDKRIDAQYYIKIDQENKIKSMLQEARIFVSDFDEIISNLTENEVKSYRKLISKNR
jgi:uncharacterized protein (UPF0332 family)